MYSVILSAMPNRDDHKRVSKRGWAKLGRLGGLWTSLVMLTYLSIGCATVSPPAATELKAVQTGRTAIVLFRVTSEVDGEPYEPFSHTLIDDNIGLALGGFETGGKVEPVQSYRFLSKETRQQGWIYFILEPGTYYLAVQPPRNTNAFTYASGFQYAPHWRIDVPTDARLVYAGTLHLPGSGQWVLFGSRRLTSFTALTVRNEEDLARKIASEHLAELGTPLTVPMQLYTGGPILLRTPKREKGGQ